mgnify:FL=1
MGAQVFTFPGLCAYGMEEERDQAKLLLFII